MAFNHIDLVADDVVGADEPGVEHVDGSVSGPDVVGHAEDVEG